MMKKVQINKLVPGMKLATDVYAYGNHILLPEGFILDEYSIAKIQESDNSYVNIKEPSSHSERVQTTPEFVAFSKEFVKNVSLLKDTLNSVVSDETPLDTKELLDSTMSMFDNARGALHLFDMIHNIRNFDDATFAHSMNVALICNILAEWQGMSKEEIELATLCGLLHDIGKLTIPEEIANKKESELTPEEFEIMRKHPYEGYKILSKNNVDPHIAKAAMMHHERCDGKGYPLGFTAEKIDIYAKIVSIADVYDYMTSSQSFPKNVSPFGVLKILEDEGLRKYDSFLVMTFLENIINSYISNTVQLSDGRVGEVVFINKQYPSRPLLKCGNTFIDLSKEPSDIVIEKIL